MSQRPSGVEFTIEELIAHMKSYERLHGITEITPETRYFVKEAGAHFVTERIGLSPQEQEELKKVISERICLEEALATFTIPAGYLLQILDNLLPELKNSPEFKKIGIKTYHIAEVKKFAVRLYETTAKALEALVRSQLNDRSNFPSPFRLSAEGPYIAVRQEGIRGLLEVAEGVFNSRKVSAIINTPEREQRFSYGGEAIRSYLDRHPTIMGPSRN